MTEVMAAEIEKLIERLEKATGPDRELDAAIEAALCCPCYSESLPALSNGWTWDFEAESDYVTVYMVLGNKTSKKLKRYSAPKYSESVDAALTLVPEGKFVNALNQHQNVWRAEVGNAIRSYKGRSAIPANSPAIALCIAALRALSHKGSSND